MLNFPIYQTNGSAAKSKSCKVVPQAGCCKDGENLQFIVKIDFRQSDNISMQDMEKTQLISKTKMKSS